MRIITQKIPPEAAKLKAEAMSHLHQQTMEHTTTFPNYAVFVAEEAVVWNATAQVIAVIATEREGHCAIIVPAENAIAVAEQVMSTNMWEYCTENIPAQCVMDQEIAMFAAAADILIV